jgi:predicted kinase
MKAESLGRDARKLREGLGELPEPVARPVFVMVSGLPGTGKSYFSRRLTEQLPSVVVESDALRKRLFRAPSYSANESHRLFQACHRLIEDLLGGGISVILDATNLIEHQREHLYRIADRLGVKLIVVQAESPAEVVRERLGKRQEGGGEHDSSDADWYVYQRMKNKAQRIRRNYFSLDTSKDMEPILGKVVREAQR